jgi:thiamine kinase-like enzyme
MKQLLLLLIFICQILTASVEDKLAFVLERLPEWNAETAKVEQAVGGATNYGYIVKYKNTDGMKHRYFIRIQTENREAASSDIMNEIECQNIAADFGIAPKIVLAFPEEGIIVTRFVRTKKNEVNFNDPAMLQKCLSVIRAIHRLPASFPQSINPFDLIDELAAKALSIGCTLPKEWDGAIADALEDMKLKSYDCCRSVPCHLDLTSENLLDDGDRIWAIDWEFSANSDPFFDLGTLISGSKLDDDRLGAVFIGYCGNYPEDFAHFYRMTILAELRWHLWCLIQRKTSPLDCPYGEWSEVWLQRALGKLKKIS